MVKKSKFQELDSVILGDGIAGVKTIPDIFVHLILCDVPYGISAEKWDVLHDNKNSALLGSSPAQERAGSVFKHRGKPLNGWSKADRHMMVEYQEWCASFAEDWLRVLKPGASALVFAGRRLAPRCVVAFEDAGFIFKDMFAWLRKTSVYRAQRLSLVYQRREDFKNMKRWVGWRLGNLRPVFEPVLWFVKPYPIGTTIADNALQYEMGAHNVAALNKYEGKGSGNVFRSGFEEGERGLHTAQKPVKLLSAFIELVTLPGHIVLDPFCGSGSTLVAAKKLKRRYIGFDFDKKCVEMSRKRLQRIT